MARASRLSTPSAVTFRPRLWARSMVDLTSRASLASFSSDRTKALSIFSSSALDLLQIGQGRQARAVVVDRHGDAGGGSLVSIDRATSGLPITAVSVISKQKSAPAA
jgi:hypothetical protein